MNAVRPVLKKRYVPIVLVWLLPVCVAVAALFYCKSYFAGRGPVIEIHFTDAAGLKEGETKIVYRGVEIAKVDSIDLSDDNKEAVVSVRLPRSARSFASEGAHYWIVRPEVSQMGLKGLDTLMTGPYIHASPGAGKTAEREFAGLAKEPRFHEDGTKITLTTVKLGHIQDGSVVSYKGIPVGEVDEIVLAADATHVNVKIVVWERYAHLVHTNSKFWVESGFDFDGGILAGVHLKLDSLKTVISGGVAFATPEKEMGPQVHSGASFGLDEDPKREWRNWSPPLSVNPKPSDAPEVKGDLSKAQQSPKK